MKQKVMMKESIIENINLFAKFKKTGQFNYRNAYWITFLLKNNSKYDKEISISPISRWNLAQTSIINENDEIIKLTDTGFSFNLHQLS